MHISINHPVLVHSLLLPFLLLFFQLLPFASPSPAPGRPKYTGKKWCKIPEEYCITHGGSDRVCYMPLGMRCERSGEIVDFTQTITETVTVAIPFDEMVETGLPEFQFVNENNGEEERNKTKRELGEEEVKEPPEDQMPGVFEECAASVATPMPVLYAYMGDFSIQAGATPLPKSERLLESDIKFTDYTELNMPLITERDHIEEEVLDDARPPKSSSKPPPSAPPSQIFVAMQSPKTVWAEKPVLEVSCVVRPRLLWDDFKVTWGPAWKDAPGCHRLFHALDKRGLVTGYKCEQFADTTTNSFYMEARGHRPRFPKVLVADAIRETFSNENTLYYRGYENSLLCERNSNSWFSKKL